MKRKAVFLISLTGVFVFAIAAAQSFRTVRAAESVQGQPTVDSVATVVQMSYYAQPGKEEQVLQVRLLTWPA